MQRDEPRVSVQHKTADQLNTIFVGLEIPLVTCPSRGQLVANTMSKVERLNARVAKLLTVAVHEVLEVVRETVSEYQEKTARTQRENERLRRKVQELQGKQRRDCVGKFA